MRWQDRSKTERRNIMLGSLMVLGFVFVPLVLLGGVQGFYAGAAVIGLVCFLILMLFGIPILPVAVHELGHFAAGFCLGFKFHALRIGPLLWQSSAGGVRFSRSKQLWSGYCAMSPRSNRGVVLKYSLFILGGPLASALLVWLLYAFVPMEWLVHRGAGGVLEQVWHLFARFLGLYSVMVLLFATVPYTTKRGVANDAARLLLPLVNRREAELRVLILTWSEDGNSDEACKDWDVPTLRRIVELAKAPYDSAIYRNYLADALLYRGEIEEGLRLNEESYNLLEKSSGVFAEGEAVLMWDIAFSRAFFGKDLAGAEEALARGLQRYDAKTYGFFRASAGIALLKGEAVEAIKAALAGIEWLDKNADVSKPQIQACYAEMKALRGMAASISPPLASSKLDDASGTASGTSASPAP